MVSNLASTVYRRAHKFMQKVLAELPLGSIVTWLELRKLMIKHGLASDKLTIRAYQERLEIFGFVDKLGLSGKYRLRHPDLEHSALILEAEDREQLKKVVSSNG